jgi:hypothetical protein
VTKKALKLEPHRNAKLQTYTVEVYCHKGERMSSPVKRIKGCWTQQEVVQGYTILEINNKQKPAYDSEPTGFLVFATTVLQMDGIWVYGMEQIGMKTYYQVWCLLPEPNEYTDGEKGSNRSRGAGEGVAGEHTVPS